MKKRSYISTPFDQNNSDAVSFNFSRAGLFRKQLVICSVQEKPGKRGCIIETITGLKTGMYPVWRRGISSPGGIPILYLSALCASIGQEFQKGNHR
jgi:hypothetical protein